jgi:hypothetical protein
VIGVDSCGDYHSISTGKATTAPMLGERAAQAVRSGVVRSEAQCTGLGR